VERRAEGAVDDTRKVKIELDIDAHLLADAERAGIDVSQTVERALRRRLGAHSSEWRADQAEQARLWREQNAEAIRLSNEELERNGLWSDGLRLF
jgi:antitoxin CcdA